VADTLRDRLFASSKQTRLLAVRAAIVDERRDMTPALAEVLAHDPDGEVRSSAAEALGRLGGADMVAPIGEAARTDASVRHPACNALGRIGHPSAVEYLLAASRQAMEDAGHELQPGSDPAQAALATLLPPHQADLHALAASLNDPPKDRESALASLGTFGGLEELRAVAAAFLHGPAPAPPEALLACWRIAQRLEDRGLPVWLGVHRDRSAHPSSRRFARDAVSWDWALHPDSPQPRRSVPVPPPSGLETLLGGESEEAAALEIVPAGDPAPVAFQERVEFLLDVLSEPDASLSDRVVGQVCDVLPRLPMATSGRVIGALAATGDPRARERLLRLAAEHAGSEVGRLAQRAVGGADREDSTLRAAIATASWRDALRALEGLGKLDVSLMSAVLHDPRLEVRLSAAGWLARELGPQATPLLLSAYEADGWREDRVRWEGNGRADDPWGNAIFPLPSYAMRGVQIESQSHAVSAAREALLGMLASVGDARALPALIAGGRPRGVARILSSGATPAADALLSFVQAEVRDAGLDHPPWLPTVALALEQLGEAASREVYESVLRHRRELGDAMTLRLLAPLDARGATPGTTAAAASLAGAFVDDLVSRRGPGFAEDLSRVLEVLSRLGGEHARRAYEILLAHWDEVPSPAVALEVVARSSDVRALPRIVAWARERDVAEPLERLLAAHAEETDEATLRSILEIADRWTWEQAGDTKRQRLVEFEAARRSAWSELRRRGIAAPDPPRSPFRLG
jgi:HEAT repeat protein